MKLIHEFGAVLDIPEKTKQWNADAKGMSYMVLWHTTGGALGSLAFVRAKHQLEEVYGDKTKVSVELSGGSILITVEANT